MNRNLSEHSWTPKDIRKIYSDTLFSYIDHDIELMFTNDGDFCLSFREPLNDSYHFDGIYQLNGNEISLTYITADCSERCILTYDSLLKEIPLGVIKTKFKIIGESLEFDDDILGGTASFTLRCFSPSQKKT